MSAVAIPTQATPRARSRIGVGVLLAFFVLAVVLICVIAGPELLGAQARAVNLRQRNAVPFNFDDGLLYVLGADNLGRSILARLIVASRNTIVISGSAVSICLVLGSVLGLIAGYLQNAVSGVIMRVMDTLMSFPTLLLAVAMIAVLKPSIFNVMIVLAISRLPVFVRTVRAETLEIKQRAYVVAARAMGAPLHRIMWHHILPSVMPVLLTLSALELAAVMLMESGLSFLGIGIQPPEMTWGIMVSDGRNYIASAWWVSFWPGMSIMAVTMSLIVISNWLRGRSGLARRRNPSKKAEAGK